MDAEPWIVGKIAPVDPIPGEISEREARDSSRRRGDKGNGRNVAENQARPQFPDPGDLAVTASRPGSRKTVEPLERPWKVRDESIRLADTDIGFYRVNDESTFGGRKEPGWHRGPQVHDHITSPREKNPKHLGHAHGMSEAMPGHVHGDGARPVHFNSREKLNHVDSRRRRRHGDFPRASGSRRR